MRFELLEDVYEEYSYYQFDSAFVYARKSFELAREMGDSAAVNRSYLMLMKCFSSVGLLKESSDLKNKIDTAYLSHSDKLNFLRQTASLYINLNSFLGDNSPISCYYDAKRDEFTGKALAECSSDSDLLFILELERRKSSDLSLAEEIKERQTLIAVHDLPIHELAMQYCAIGRAFIEAGDTDAAIYHIALSAICDQRICNNETMSTYILADLMHRRGDIDRATKYIYAALDEANFLNSRLRKIEINAILPEIVDTRLNVSRTQKHVVIVISSVILALLLWVLLLWLKVRRRNRSLSKAHEESRIQTEILNDTNARLIAINEKLEEDDEIKNRCIMESLYAN
ncbi:MAG: hypothetical protein K2K05_06735, partial [Muribaculaceae bacterium]|nr:hypothetical protein [Muribaculaceae bacterium]